MTMISRVLGFARDVLIARLFGAGTGADAFFVAFRIPNLFRRLFAEGAFSQAFIPVLSEYRSQRDLQEVRGLIASAAGVLGGVLLVLTTLAIIAAPLVVLVFAPGFRDDADKFALTVDMLRITFPYLLLVSLTALAGGVLNTYGRFGVPAFTPVFLNLSIIGAALYVAPYLQQPVVALAIGVLLGGMTQLLFQLPFLARLGVLVRPTWNRGHDGVKRIMALMLPAMFGASVTQVNLLIDTLLASFLVTGSISWLYYADRLVEFPLGVFGIALATVLLPNLSRCHSGGDTAAFSAAIDWALAWVVLIGTPATIGLVMLAEPMLTTLFQYGEFSAADVRMASLALIAYSTGLFGFVLVKVLAPAYFSRQDTRTPVRIGFVAVAVNLILNVILIFPLAHAGLALATAIAAFVNAGLLYRGLIKSGVYQAGAHWLALLPRVGVAALVLITVLVYAVPGLDVWAAWAGPQRIGQLAFLVGIGASVYFAALWLVGWRPRQMILRATGPDTV